MKCSTCKHMSKQVWDRAGMVYCYARDKNIDHRKVAYCELHKSKYGQIKPYGTHKVTIIKESE